MLNSKSYKKSGALLLIICIAIGFCALYFVGLGKSPLTDPDEPVYGQVAKEMANGSSWLTPHYNGKPWFDKPPLFYWISAVSTSALGVNEFSARLPSAIMGVAVVMLVFILARYDFGRRAGIFSAIAMATCLQQIVLAHAAVTDMTLVFFLTLALYGYRRWIDSEGNARFGWMALCGAAAGLGMLTKGPVAPLLLIITFCIHLKWTGNLRKLVSPDFLTGVLVSLLIGLPWYIAMYLSYKTDFVQGFLVANNIQRFLKPEHGNQTGRWYSYFLNIPIIFVFFFPWSIFLIQSLRKCGKINTGTKLALVWFATVLVFFSLSKTLLVTYVFPLYPAAALLVGVYLDQAASREACRAVHSAFLVGLAASLLLAVILAITAHSKFPEAGPSVVVLGTLLAATFLTASTVAGQKHRQGIETAVSIIGIGMAFFAMWLAYVVMPAIASRISTRDLLANSPYKPSVKLISFDADYPSALFYAGRLPEKIVDPETVQKALAGRTPVFVILRASKIARLAVRSPLYCARSGDLIMLSNQPGAERK